MEDEANQPPPAAAKVDTVDTNGAEPASSSAWRDEIVAALPEEVLSLLVRATPQRAVWRWLNEDSRAHLLHDLTRGFQRTTQALRMPVVRVRLMHHLRYHPGDFFTLLQLWGEITPPPPALAAVREQPDEAALTAHLPELWQRHGAESLMLALLLDERRAAFEMLDDVAAQVSSSAPPAPDEAGQTTEQAATAASAVLEVDLARAQQERDQWRTRAETAAAEAARTRDAANVAQAQQQNATRALQREIKQLTRRAESAETTLDDTKKVLDRTARRGRGADKEVAELSAENKRMKRQLRRQQEISEELRKQLSSLTAKLEEVQRAAKAKTAAKPTASNTKPKEAKSATVKAAVPTVTKPPPRPVAPLDQAFVWHSDGRAIRVTPREVRNAIDRNDEDFVFHLIQALDALRETNEAGYRLFLDRLREVDRYYGRVLTTGTTRVLVDASNVARFEPDRYGRGQLGHLMAMRDELRRRDCFPILIYADASLPYNIDEPDELQRMIKQNEVSITRSGQEADEILAREARRTGAYVVTNDRNFHHKVTPDFEPLRITFRIFDGVLIVDEF